MRWSCSGREKKKHHTVQIHETRMRADIRFRSIPSARIVPVRFYRTITQNTVKVF